MSGTPEIKIYTADNEYVASFKYFEDAASFAAFRGKGTTVRYGHKKSCTLWTEGAEEFSAGESFDRAALLMTTRYEAMQRAAYERAYGRAPAPLRAAQ